MKLMFSLIMALLIKMPPPINQQSPGHSNISPLALYSEEWNKSVYEKCNTSASATYMNPKEKEVIYIMNLVRTFPNLFAKTVLAKYPFFSGNDELANDEYYYRSLVHKMLSMEAQPLLYADKKCYLSAACHAASSGIAGYTGHDRVNSQCKKKQYFMGECCDYGNSEPLEIVLSLLIDEDVPSLGHRNTLLGYYDRVGVSIQPHKTYRYTAVIDLYY